MPSSDHSQASPLFPYTTLFRSNELALHHVAAEKEAHRRGCYPGELPLLLEVSHQFWIHGIPHWRDRIRPLGCRHLLARRHFNCRQDRKSTRLNSSHVSISYAVF